MIIVRRLIYVLAAALVVVAAVVAVAGAAGAGGLPAQPLGVQAASLTQVGQDLVWQVELNRSFSPGALRRNHESLCLMIERASTGSVASQVCVGGLATASIPLSSSTRPSRAPFPVQRSRSTPP
jgi:hypothetical protein